MELIINNLQIIQTKYPYNQEDTMYHKTHSTFKITTKANDIKSYISRYNIESTFGIETGSRELFYHMGYLLIKESGTIVGVIGKLNEYIPKHLRINTYFNQEWELFLNKDYIDKKFIDQVLKYAGIKVNLLSSSMFSMLCQTKVKLPDDANTTKLLIENYLKQSFTGITNLELLGDNKKEETNLFTGTEEVTKNTIDEIFEVAAETDEEYLTCLSCGDEFPSGQIDDDGYCMDCAASEEEDYEEEREEAGNPF